MDKSNRKDQKMLTFHEDEDFVVTQTTHCFDGTSKMVVRYKKDLSQIKVHNDPWRDTNPAQVQWFEKYYGPKFQGKNNENPSL